jgi:hypothetical protein
MLQLRIKIPLCNKMFDVSLLLQCIEKVWDIMSGISVTRHGAELAGGVTDTGGESECPSFGAEGGSSWIYVAALTTYRS